MSLKIQVLRVQEMQVRFGANIANLVEGVTKIGQYNLSVSRYPPLIATNYR